MGGDQITLVALMILLVAAILIGMAILTKSKAKGTVKLPGGFVLEIETEDRHYPNPTNVPGQLQDAIKSIIWQYNTSYAAVLTGENEAVLEQATTPAGFELARGFARNAREHFQSNAILSGELRDIKWIAFEPIDPRTMRVTDDETWEWIYANHQRVRAVARNVYVTKCTDAGWRVDAHKLIAQGMR